MLQFHTVDVILQVGKRTVYNGIRKEKKRQSDRAIRSGAGLYSSESIKPDRMASPPTHFTSTLLFVVQLQWSDFCFSCTMNVEARSQSEKFKKMLLFSVDKECGSIYT